MAQLDQNLQPSIKQVTRVLLNTADPIQHDSQTVWSIDSIKVPTSDRTIIYIKSLKAHSHLAKTKILFDVRRLFFDLFRFRLVKIDPKNIKLEHSTDIKTWESLPHCIPEGEPILISENNPEVSLVSWITQK